MEEIWLLTTEDGDGNWRGFCGLYSSKELAFEYAKKLCQRTLSDTESFVMEPAKSFPPEFPSGGYVIINDSYDVLIRNSVGAWTIYNIEKVEVTKE